jgi:hypothetical protein
MEKVLHWRRPHLEPPGRQRRYVVRDAEYTTSARGSIQTSTPLRRVSRRHAECDRAVPLASDSRIAAKICLVLPSILLNT